MPATRPPSARAKPQARPRVRPGVGVLAASLVTVLVGVLGGCAVNVSELPLPAIGLPGPTYQLTAVFDDALNLPEGAHVKLGGDDIGRVRAIEADNFTARVTMHLRADITLPAGTRAELRQTTPLGEVFVALHPPTRPTPGAPLRDGDTLGPQDTESAAAVEDLLASLSAVVNGGGLAQIHTIAHETNQALYGRAPQLDHLINLNRQTLTTLNTHTTDFDRVLSAADRASTALRERSHTIDAAFQHLPPAIQIFADHTHHYIRTLNTAGQASDTTDHLLDRTNHHTRDLLHAAGPVLDGFSDTRPILAQSLLSLIQLGKSLEHAGQGESGVGHGLLTVLPPPITLSTPPTPNDPTDPARSLAQILRNHTQPRPTPK